MSEAPDAWIELVSGETLLQAMPAGGPYDFGFALGMARLVLSHPRLGAAFGGLFAEIMFSPEGALTRPEREMVASVAAAAQDCFY